MATAARSDECKLCKKLLKNKRYLKCGHSFCLECLVELEKSETLKCPVCRADTPITPGLLVKHLPKMYIAPQATANKDISMVVSWEVDKAPPSLVIDEEAQVVYIAQWGNQKEPIQIYSFNKDKLGFLTSDIKDLTYSYLAMDSKRGVLLATARQHILSFNREGLQTGVITCKEFTDIRDIAHYQFSDKYIVSDQGARAIHFVDPKSSSVTRTIPATSGTPMMGVAPTMGVVKIACAKTEGMSLWSATDSLANKLGIYGPEGLVVKMFGSGSVHEPFDGLSGTYMTKRGQLVMCDMHNDRLVHMRIDSAEKEWEVLTNTKQHNLGDPWAIDITEDGLAVMSMYDYPYIGPYHIAILSGFDNLY